MQNNIFRKILIQSALTLGVLFVIFGFIALIDKIFHLSISPYDSGISQISLTFSLFSAIIAMGIIWQIFEWQNNKKERMRNEFYAEAKYFTDKIFAEQKEISESGFTLKVISFEETFNTPESFFGNPHIKENIETKYLAQLIFHYINFLIRKESIIIELQNEGLEFYDIFTFIPGMHYLYFQHLKYLADIQIINKEITTKILEKYNPFYEKYLKNSGIGLGTFEKN